MTVLEAIQANPVFLDVPVDYISAVLSGRSVDGSATYTADALKDLELVTADLYYDMALLPEFREGQLMLKYNAKTLKQRAKQLYVKYDDPKAVEFDPQPIHVGISTVEDV